MTSPSVPLPLVTLGKTGLKVSPIGFGGYRISAQIETHRQALKLALSSGCTLIDTSTNYGDGQSEILIGEVIQEMVSSQKLKREDLTIVSKVGYVQGDNLTLLSKEKSAVSPLKKWSSTHPTAGTASLMSFCEIN
jgi:aryl-alcohol dehydrogenase-like predicted oxidoreductase